MSTLAPPAMFGGSFAAGALPAAATTSSILPEVSVAAWAVKASAEARYHALSGCASIFAHYEAIETMCQEVLGSKLYFITVQITPPPPPGVMPTPPEFVLLRILKHGGTHTLQGMLTGPDADRPRVISDGEFATTRAATSAPSAKDGDDERVRHIRAQVYESFIEGGMSPDDAARFVKTMPQCVIDEALIENGGVSEGMLEGMPEGMHVDEGVEMWDDDFIKSLTAEDCMEREYPEDDPQWIMGRPTAELQELCRAHGRDDSGSRLELVRQLMRVLREAEDSEDEG